MQTLAIIGSGISGLGAAWFLHREFDVTVFEAADYIGGHTCTVTVDEAGRAVPIDTGFMVFNHATYPHLTRLFHTLGVATKPTGMSFGVQHRPRGLEYSGSSLNHLFAQRRNLLRPSFYRLLRQIDRFNREATVALDEPAVRQMSLDDYVRRGGYGDDFAQLYLLPMCSAVWSTPPQKMRRFPAATLLRFLDNHGLLGLDTQHQWWTVEGGAQRYVEKLTAPFRDRIRRRSPVRAVRRLADGGVEVMTETAAARFDKAILACHPPPALDLLGDGATADERRLLAPFQYQPNTATLHTDESVMPRTRRAWSAWNYRLDAPAATASPSTPTGRSDDANAGGLRASTHYWMNQLQGVSDRVNYFVSIEGGHLIDPARTLRTLAYEHPLFDLAAAQAQPDLAGLNANARGRTETYFAGAWQRYGFHEDGLLSAVNLATLLLGRDPWTSAVASKEAV
jgi:predicted NAD/FAD-binding protein